MKFLKIFLAIIIVLLVAVLGFYGYYGGFTDVSFRIETQGGETVVYEEVTGDYFKTRVHVDKISDSLLQEESIETTRGFGIFYDNPKKVPANKLRSQAGAVIDMEIDSLQRVHLSEKYNLKILPRTKYIVTEFPYKGSVSVIVGLYRVYPALERFSKNNNITGDGPVTEIYDATNKKITYRKELN